MDTKTFRQYAEALRALGVPGEVLGFIVTAYGEGTRAAVDLLDSAAWCYLGLRDYEQVAEALDEAL